MVSRVQETEEHIRSPRAKYNELSRISQDPEIMIEKYGQYHKRVTEKRNIKQKLCKSCRVRSEKNKIVPQVKMAEKFMLLQTKEKPQ